MKDTHVSLKAALAPLTFAYGEEDGQAMYDGLKEKHWTLATYNPRPPPPPTPPPPIPARYETVLNDPDKYKADKRPAFQHVAVAALAHDDAMHEAGDAQRVLEDYDNRALPPALFRRVVNQRFKGIEQRLRQLEQCVQQGVDSGVESVALHVKATSAGTGPVGSAVEPLTPDATVGVGVGPVGMGMPRKVGANIEVEVTRAAPHTGPALVEPAGPMERATTPTAKMATATAQGAHAHHAAAAAAVEPVDISRAEEAAPSSLPRGPTMVQHWHCEVRDAVRTNMNDQTFGSFVVTVSPVFPAVHVDADPEFNAIHQRRANRKQVAQFVHFLQQVRCIRRVTCDSTTKRHRRRAGSLLCSLLSPALSKLPTDAGHDRPDRPRTGAW